MPAPGKGVALLACFSEPGASLVVLVLHWFGVQRGVGPHTLVRDLGTALSRMLLRMLPGAGGGRGHYVMVAILYALVMLTVHVVTLTVLVWGAMWFMSFMS